MFEFLLLLFIIFIVVSVVRVAWTIHKVRRQYRQAFEAARGQASRQQSDSNRHRGGWSVPRRKKGKVVDRNEGEYVEWEEVTVSGYSASTDGNGSRGDSENIRVEERITDAEWEEIK